MTDLLSPEASSAPACGTCGHPMAFAKSIGYFCETCPFDWSKPSAPAGEPDDGPELTPEQIAEERAEYEKWLYDRQAPQRRIAELEAQVETLTAERDTLKAERDAAERDASNLRGLLVGEVKLAEQAEQHLTTLRTALEEYTAGNRAFYGDPSSDHPRRVRDAVFGMLMDLDALVRERSEG